MPVQVITESNTGLGGGLGQRLGIRVLSHYVNYHGRSYPELSVDRKEFLSWLEKGEEITSAHPTVQDLVTAFTHAGENGDPIVYIPISSYASKSYDLALSVRERLPHLQIEVFDSKRALGGQAMVALEAARLAQEGYELEKVISGLKKADACIDEIMVFDTLRQLAHEGRVDSAETTFSSLIKVKPLIAHREGVATPIGKVRTNQQALDRIVTEIKQTLAKCEGTDLRVLVEYGTDEGWVEQVIGRLDYEFSPQETWKVPASPLSVLHIGLHGWSVAWKVER